MINNKEHDDDINWGKIINWLSVSTICGLWWWSVFAKGFFITIVWSVVIIAVGALWLTVKDTRV